MTGQKGLEGGEQHHEERRPFAPSEGLGLPGESGRIAIADVVRGFRAKGLATPYDEVVSGRVAQVLTGGDTDIIDVVTEEALLTLERQVFLDAMRDTRTQDRVTHVLQTGKPLRN